MSARKILFVGHQDPTGRGSGLLVRTLGVGRGLATAGEVHYLQRRGRSWRSSGTVVRRPPPDPALPFSEWTQIAAFGVPHRLKPALRYPWAVGAALAPDHARPLLAARYPRISGRAVHDALPALDQYDLIWFYRLETILAFWPLFASAQIPCVADIDDLASADREDVGDAGSSHRWHAALDKRIHALDQRAWSHWQDEVLARADTVVLSNPREAAAVQARRVRIVANGCQVPPRVGAREPSPRPVLTFVGGMHYFPNADAVRYFVHEVLPPLRARLKTPFEIRVVGEAPASIHALASQPEVTVTGYVDDFAPELARTDVMIVPLRHGTGTRLKILEAFAHGVPVVSTTVGASGLDVRDQEHLLIADDPDNFAAACARLVGDHVLRKAVARAAYDLVASRYDWSVVGQDIANIVSETIAGTP